MASLADASAEFVRRPSSGLSKWVKGRTSSKVDDSKAPAKFADPGPGWKVLGHRRRCRLALACEEESERVAPTELDEGLFERNHSGDSDQDHSTLSSATTDADSSTDVEARTRSTSSSVSFERSFSAAPVTSRNVEIGIEAPEKLTSDEEDLAIERWSRAMGMPSEGNGNLLTQSEGWHMLGLRKKVREGKTIKVHKHCVFKVEGPKPAQAKDQKSFLGGLKDKISRAIH